MKEQIYHCQICARDIKAKNGLIAHHGYQRPGYGWQTESCMGARFEPYEVSRDRIPAVLDAYKAMYKRIEAEHKEFLKNPPATITRHYISPYTNKRDEKYDETYERPEGFSAEESLKIEKPSFYDQKYEREFNFQVYQMERNVRDIKETRDWLQRRYDDWKKV